MLLTRIINLLLCALIAGSGAGILLFLRSIRRELVRIDRSFDKIITRTDISETPERLDAEGNIHISHASHVRYDREALEKNRARFSEAYANYVTGGQLISLLPLLGIFGTVLGLILSSGTSDIAQMVAGLGTAMWTTLLGLIFSIGLKAYDAVCIGRTVNLIDARFADADAIITRQVLQNEMQLARKAADKKV